MCPPNTLDKEYIGSAYCAGGTVAVPEIRFSKYLINKNVLIIINFKY